VSPGVTVAVLITDCAESVAGIAAVIVMGGASVAAAKSALRKQVTT
jgi:hypothetical protein